jgi:hypothetical protein
MDNPTMWLPSMLDCCRPLMMHRQRRMNMRESRCDDKVLARSSLTPRADTTSKSTFSTDQQRPQHNSSPLSSPFPQPPPNLDPSFTSHPPPPVYREKSPFPSPSP